MSCNVKYLTCNFSINVLAKQTAIGLINFKGFSMFCLTPSLVSPLLSPSSCNVAPRLRPTIKLKSSSWLILSKNNFVAETAPSKNSLNVKCNNLFQSEPIATRIVA